MSDPARDLIEALDRILGRRGLATLATVERSRLALAVDAIRREARAAARGVGEPPPPTPAEVREACARECERRCGRRISADDGREERAGAARALAAAAAAIRALRLPGEAP